MKPIDVDQLVGHISQLTAQMTRGGDTEGDEMPTSADARRLVRDCCNSIETAKAALEHARVVSARAEKQVERANRFLTRIGGHQRVRATRT